MNRVKVAYVSLAFFCIILIVVNTYFFVPEIIDLSRKCRWDIKELFPEKYATHEIYTEYRKAFWNSILLFIVQIGFYGSLLAVSVFSLRDIEFEEYEEEKEPKFQKPRERLHSVRLWFNRKNTIYVIVIVVLLVVLIFMLHNLYVLLTSVENGGSTFLG